MKPTPLVPITRRPLRPAGNFCDERRNSAAHCRGCLDCGARAQSTATLSVAQLRDADCQRCSVGTRRCASCSRPPLLGQLADAETDDAAARKILMLWRLASAYENQPAQPALTAGYRSKTGSSAWYSPMSTDCRWFCHAGSVLSYRDVALLKPGACGCPPQMHRDRHGA